MAESALEKAEQKRRAKAEAEAIKAGRATGPPPWMVKPAAGLADPGISATDLLALDIPPVQFAVPGLLCEGLTILGGRPKQGKSWLALLIAWAVAGGHSLDGRQCTGGDVLLLALEDTRRRLQSRMRMLQPAVGWPIPPRLKFHTAWPRAEQGGLYYLAEWLEENKAGAKLVVIDTMTKFRSGRKGSGNTYDEDYEALGQIKTLADRYETASLAVHHTRKLPAEDPFDELSGTLAISGAADGLVMLDRKRGSNEGKLFVTGRDVPEATIPLTLDRSTWRWTLSPAKDGIDTSGRHVSTASNRVDQCVAWLREFLRDYAYPAEEIVKAGRAAGFGFGVVKSAKAKLGQNDLGELFNTKFGTNNWWSGLGPPSEWAKRPEAGNNGTGPDLWPGGSTGSTGSTGGGDHHGRNNEELPD